MRHYNRYQTYLPLVTVCFWAKIAVWTFYLVQAHAWRSLGQITPLWTLAWIISTATWLLLIFLVLARFMRDEFAEKLWQRAAANFGYFILIAPFAIWIIIAFCEAWIISVLRTREHLVKSAIYEQHLPSGIAHDHNVGGIAFNEFVGVVFSLQWLTTFMPVVFAGLILWHRWRDS